MKTTILATRGHSDFEVTITEQAEAERKSALALTASILTVTTAAEQADAIAAASMAKSLVKACEAMRVEIKRPIIDAGTAIDDCAKIFANKLKSEIARVEGLAAEYQREQNRIAAEARAAEEAKQAFARRQEDEERRADLARIAAADTEAAKEAARIAADESAERRAEEERLRHAALQATAAPKAAGASIKVQMDYEVTDIDALYRAYPRFVKLEPRRTDILAMLSVPNCPVIPGLRIFETTKVQAKI